MSRGFVKEDDQEEAPFIPPRAALPAGAINYVTPVGYHQLLREKEQLEIQLTSINIVDEKEKRHARAVLNGRLMLLIERINSARIIDPVDQPLDEVRFGAVVTYKNLTGGKIGEVERYQIVGVDEADIRLNKIAFVAPLAKILTGRKKGDIVDFSRGPQLQQFEIQDIHYDIHREL
ncbi:GreA/GreB family elongation factor [Antarcticibacterium sp. 1MA-6-2]|uniref:GreA/GreB family elongation factor n=1 Tax=Antarcticibacterium sp. 1MA-6-2 TaxID=2908210 RepID=UPI001F31771D|nr:GreA/GreB family elongation factor [Antarcticibacterium sp. 1MA-6-2]UJH91577.1 GreA/GreB family elongation factor [Antarcticibacterium sp. 1MA-6-2]